MNKLIMQFDNQLKSLNLQSRKSYVISGQEDATVTFEGMQSEIVLTQTKSGTWYTNDYPLQSKTSLNHLEMTLFTDKDMYAFYFKSEPVMTLGPNPYDDVHIPEMHNTLIVKGLEDYKKTQSLQLIYDAESDVYINYDKQVRGPYQLGIGDHLYLEGMMIELREEGFYLITQHKVESQLVQMTIKKPNALDAQYHDYQRSPRIIHREPKEPIKIEKPPQPVQKNNSAIWRSIIPPLVMIALTVVIFLVRPIGIYIIMMIGMCLVTITFGITSYFSDRKRYKKEVKERETAYLKYLREKTSQIHKAMNQQRFSLNFHFPTLHEIQEIVETRAPRIYEKTVHHHDFLHYRLGIADIDKSFKIDYYEEEFNQRRDFLFDEAKKLNDFYQKLEQAPLINDLTHGPVAYVGERRHIITQLEQTLLQLATFHSYHEVEFLIVMDEHERDDFQWTRWLPHMNLRHHNIRSFVYNQRTRDQILTSVYTMIKERVQHVRELQQSEQVLFTPHLVFVITDMSRILDHVILEYINQDLTPYGISLIFVEDVVESLPEHVKTIVDIKSATEGELLMKEGELVHVPFTPVQTDDVNKEYVARRLANLNHVEQMKNAIPESITFLEMYQVEDVEALNVKQRWRENETYKTMAVPLGVRGKDDLLYLNLHERAHGPHGLIAGTTGSGKSEIIQSYILSLAVNFHPHEVAFLLIDYKGGGMANLFKDLAHLVGTITNLDGDEAMRALTSIKAELRRRQRLFGKHDVNHINHYHKLFKEGIAKDPMPHLFIISDEFAELKSEQPEFMKELVSTARIGRSLGIHLILATQKPSGVVDDQIWSNSKFKLALKVQDKQDSNEILKTPDAADITLPGRAYLQVGNNEIYELFQSAYSGGTYNQTGAHAETEDQTIYLINDYGQLQAINKDLSGLEEVATSSNETELEAVIRHLQDVTTALNVSRVKRPWLPPLPSHVYQSDLTETAFQKLWEDQLKPVTLTLGFKDVPEAQYQGPLALKLNQAGHVAVIGSPGYGRSTFLHNVIFDIARHYRPNQAHMYLFDFGTNGLMPVADVPHVADYFTADQEEKIKKALKRIDEVISERKKILSQNRVVNMEQYHQFTGQTVPNLFVLIDNYDTIKETTYQEAFEAMMTKLTREGLALGMYLILTGSNTSSIRTPIYTNIKTKIALYLFEHSEITNVIGSYKKGVKDLKGRAVINDDDYTQFQIALPFKPEEGITYNEQIQNEIAVMKENFVGDMPTHIPMMPEKVLRTELEKEYNLEDIVKNSHQIPLGLDFESVKLVSLDLNTPSIVTALKPIEQEHLNENIMHYLGIYKQLETVILVDADENMDRFSNKVTSYYASTTELSMIRKGFIQEIEARKTGKRSSAKRKVVFINNIKRFIQVTGVTEDEVRRLFNEASTYNIIIIASGLYSDTIGAYDKQSKMMTRIVNQAVISHKISEQEFLSVKNQYGEPELKTRESYMVKNQEYQKLMLME
ncbi:type VII secretion protein EssC [Staphylococcus chromogenes]|uniref:type VII secretion protein EssC n=2 Tax=Staphylococcus chromogenes TaxID=46126 RepID=UPI000D046BDC|nr:type VII secretion protein EssC [Staphylococcus chromogenes]MCE5044133.1 type VII secretion protein EssC [Staphylococcus chromogenes]PTF56677.1 type VII secretion protein EssC [Staphylococcus chromogenes]PTF74825.1 type VII secretion protein EssC [Staphylococcus chromogenes]PTF90162.1 type VII secretion protein EssC [Staphylococcus chromogenes]PTG00358.1 type VII secretion protein EssC [Staphylococcus chromogenes]